MKYPRCNFCLSSAQDLSSLISGRSASRAPFSLIRLGDGEGLFLTSNEQSFDVDFDYLARHLGPAVNNLDDMLQLKDDLISAIRAADVIGVRDDIVNVEFGQEEFTLPPGEFLDHFRRNFRLRDVEKNLEYAGSRRIALLHKCLSSMDLPQHTMFCSAWVQYQLQNSGSIFGLLKAQERIGVISCRSELPALLESLFELSVRYIEIPDMFGDLGTSMASDEYIAKLKRVLELRAVDEPGMIYLVGGGIYGKVYCQHIKSQGGIALDVGSLLDAWLGIPSRPPVYRSMYGSDASTRSVPHELLLTAENVREASNKGSGIIPCLRS